MEIILKPLMAPILLPLLEAIFPQALETTP
ncbi:MAG: hypothetical protein H6Q48_2378 [Deltaproteobacteria bacterium]|jgi:hypothetical protein|nr:hypothetical protein [Deltaproteobacteria bacterium]